MKWSDEHKDLLKAWVETGGSNRDALEKELGRTWPAIEQEIRRLGLKVPSGPKKQKKEYITQKSLAELKKIHKRQTFYEAVGQTILEAIPIFPSSCAVPVQIKDGPQDEEEMFLLLSDLHLGLLVDSEQTGGLGAYNFEIFEKRLTFLKKSITKIIRIHSHNTPYNVLNVLLLGDMVEGMVLRESQARLTDLPFVRQILHAWDCLADLLSWLASIIPSIRVHCVVGNHTRLGPKIGQFAPTDNFDYLLYKMLEQRLGTHANIHFNISESWWMLIERMDWRFYLEHGESFRSWLGIPFYALQRGEGNIRKLLKQYLDEACKRADFDYFIIGHIHIPSEFGYIISNGSFVGGSEFSLKNLKQGNPASQVIFGVHPQFGITWKRTLVLEDPKERPTITCYS